MKKRNLNKRGATTSEIAHLCGVSRSTVSAVLNGRPTVRENTRRKVLDCIREHNYGAGMIAKTLVGELSRMVAVLAPNLGSPFHMMVFRGINRVLVKEGYHILFHNVRPEDQSDPETLASLHAYQPAGYIILKGAEGLDAEHARNIVEKGIPLVTCGQMGDLETHTVTVDERLGMRLGADYVIDHGHRRLGHIGGPIFSTGAKERKLGFVESVVQHDIPVSDPIIVNAGETPQAGYDAALEMLKDAHSRPTAVVCFNDMLAMGVYRAAHELGLEIPRDLSVVGFDGIDFAELLGPPLTSVDIFPELLGERSAELLLKVARDQTGRSFVRDVIEPRLLERGSVRQL